MNEPWLVKSDPPAWLSVSDDEVAALREWCCRLGVRTVNLNEDTVDLDGGTFATVNASDANPPLAAAKRALRDLGTKAVQESEAKRDRAAEASESLRRRFKGRP